MRFVGLWAENFLSYKTVNYDFINKPVLVTAENRTDDSQKSNGGGKTAFQSIIEYCLDAAVSSKETDKKLIHFGEDKALVGLAIYCPVRKQELLIERIIYLKKSSELTLMLNEEPVEFATVRDGNNFIQNWLGIDKSDLRNYYIINRERYVSFFSSPNSEKLKLISRFSNAKLIDGVEDFVKEDLQIIEEKIVELTDQKNVLDGEALTYQREIEKEEQRDFKKEKIERIEKIKEKIQESHLTFSSYDEKILFQNKEIVSREKAIKEKEALLKQALSNVEKVKELETDFLEKEKELEKSLLEKKSSQESFEKMKVSQRKKKSEIFELEIEIKKDLAGTSICPKCKHEYVIGKEDVDVVKRREDLKQVSLLEEAVEKKICKIEEGLSLLEEQIKKIKGNENSLSKEKGLWKKNLSSAEESVESYEKEVDKFKKDIVSLHSNIKLLEKEKENVRQLILSYEKTIEEIQEEKDDKKRLKEYEKELSEICLKKEKIESEIREQQILLSEKKQWITNFQQFRSYLANKLLKIVQGHCNYSLQEIGSDIQVRWEGFKMKADGSLTEKITPYIIRDGEERSFGGFSGGEKARMELAMILTNQQMINKSHPYGGLDFLFIDEIFEGLDALGLSSMMKSFSKQTFPILITTHVSDEGVYEHMLKIVKENRVSRIVN